MCHKTDEQVENLVMGAKFSFLRISASTQKKERKGPYGCKDMPEMFEMPAKVSDAGKGTGKDFCC